MPRVSVVIPSCNHGRFLDRRLQSVLDQTYQDYEILFLDDASSDHSLEVFAKYQNHPRIRAFLNTANSGSPFKQWNKGVRAASGEYVWLAESDDIADARFLETLVGLLDKHPEVGLACSNSLLVDENDRVVGNLDSWTEPLHPTRWQQDFRNHGLDECQRYLIYRNTIPNASAVVFRKHLYEQAGMADETMRLCGDWAMWVKLLLISDLAYVAQPLNYYRVPHQSCARQQPASQRAYLEEHLAIVRLLRSHSTLLDEVGGQLYWRLTEEWQEHARWEIGGDAASRHARILHRARHVGPEFFSAFAATSLAATLQRTEELGQQLHALGKLVHAYTERSEGLFSEMNQSLQFWNRLRQFLLPPGSLRHRLLRQLSRVVRRAA